MIVNPLPPTAYDIVWSVVAVVIVGLAIVAIVSLSRVARRLTAVQALIWVLVVLFVPVLGPVAWLAVGRRAGLEGRPDSRT
ncbi:PLDc N-terminal domain-containing protein [Microbacterium sp. KSW4-11]|uniref:PLDc N-terminal domain-containing protein n=1 Tax=Microbacterium gawkjiense TaxID=3067309 RepID=A0ABU3GDU3_9MICO|nr:PLDc N-terminal domain-containing protein [Microbacterium sp. KSW4-11]MDT3317979.1 PLDc N-terminal domain-containing protein [Microbacterium sp. KSW4-11]